MRRRRGMSPFRAGLLAVAVIAVGTYFAFSKEVPFDSHYEVSAVFHSANNVKQRQPVRIAGVDVGQVVGIEHPEPGNGEGYSAASSRRGAPAHFHGQSYTPAIGPGGEADCENGQRGYIRRLSRFSDPKYDIVSDPETPGLQGPTYKGRRRVPRGQSFVYRPETGAKVER